MAKHYARFAKYPSRWGTAETTGISGYAKEILKVPSLCLEIPYSISNETVLTRNDYQKIGRRIITAILT